MLCCCLCVLILRYVFQLMDKDCYKDIEKIKTIGSTYMAAVGLVPTVGTEVECYFVLMCSDEHHRFKSRRYV